ncbi:YfhD family protein [Paenibacillus tarimensis]
MNFEQQERKQKRAKLPIGKNEDVEYAAELADADDREAGARAAKADRRAEES